MIDRLHHRGWHYVLLTTIAGVMFFVNLGGATLWDLDEGRNATCSYEMMVADNWVVPTFNGVLRVHKPVLLYWLQIFCYTLLGVNEFAARLPSAVAAWATVLLAYELARAMFTRTTGLLAGLIVTTAPMIWGAARFANPDALLNLFVVLALAVFWFGLESRRWWWFVVMGVSMGLAALAKGPVGVVLPGAIITLFLMWERRWSVLFDVRWGVAWFVFALTAVPWYALVGNETHGEFLRGFFLTHHVGRSMSAMESHGGFPAYYLFVLLIGTMPWSIFLLLAWWYGFWSAIRAPWPRWQSWWSAVAERPTQPAPSDATSAYRLLVCWVAMFLIAFSIAATKLPNYILPVVVPSALLIARFLQRWRTEAERVPAWVGVVCAGCLLFIGVVLGVGLAAAGGAWEWPILRGRHFDGVAPWAALALIPVAAAGACWHFTRTRRAGQCVATLCFAAVLLLGPFAAFGSAVLNNHKAPLPLVEQSATLRLDEDIRIGCWQMEHLPSLNFYVKRNVVHLHHERDVADFLQSRLHVYLFIPHEHWQRMPASRPSNARIVARHYDLYRHQQVIVLTNR